MICLAKNSKGQRCKNKSSLKKFGFCKDHSILKSDWYFLGKQWLKLPISFVIIGSFFVLSTIVAWEIEEGWSIRRKKIFKEHAENEILSKHPDGFQILILPFGSSDYCEGEKVLCERELKRFFMNVVDSDTLAPVNIIVHEPLNNIESVLSIDELVQLGHKNKADLLIWGDYRRRCSWDSTKIIVNYALFDDFASQYGGITNRVNVIEGAVENLSQLSRGELIGGLKDIVFWSLGVREALYNRNFSKGIKLLKHVDASLIKEYSGYYHLLAYCYQNNSDLNQAIHYYTVATGLNPDDFWPYNNRGALYMYLGDIDKAIVDFTKGIEISKGKNPNLYVNLSTALLQKNRDEESAFYLEYALNIDPDFEDALLLRAKLFSFAGKDDKALDDLRHARSTKETVMVLLEFSQYYMARKEYNKSKEYLEKAKRKAQEKNQYNPYRDEVTENIKLIMLQIKLLEVFHPNSKEIQKLKEDLKLVHKDKNATGVAIFSYGEYIDIKY